MNHELKKYVDDEIPVLKKYNNMIKPVMLLKIRKHHFGYDAVYMFRYCLLFSKGKNIFRKLICRRYRRLLVFRYGIHFSVTSKTKIGKGIRFPHPSSIIFGADVSVGENCIIYQNVTVGGVRVGEASEGKYPTIGDNCIIYAGSKILGNISVSNGTVVGANSVLLKDTEPNSTYAGVPAKKIK